MKKIVLWFPLLLPLYVLRLKIGPFPTTALELAFLATVIVAAITLEPTVWKIGFEKLKPWHFPAALWIVATLIAIVVAPDHIAALGLWRAFVLEPMLFAVLLAGTITDDKDKNTVISALVAVVTFVAAVAIFQFATGLGIPHPWDTDMLTRRATGPFPFPNALSLFAAPIAALCFGTLFQKKCHVESDETSSHRKISPFGRDDIFLMIGFVSGLTATILAKSVGGFIGIFTAVLFALIWKKKTRIPTIAASLLIVALLLLISPIRTRVISTLSFNEWSGQVRTTMWKETVNMLKDHPVFGAGFGAYPTVIKPYHKATYLEIFQYPHNILLNLWSETGLFGILAFGWICFVWIRLALKPTQPRNRATTPFLLLSLITILVHGLVDVPYFKNDLAFLFWIMIVLV